MPTIDANVITVNNNTASQIDMTSSLKNYRDCNEKKNQMEYRMIKAQI